MWAACLDCLQRNFVFQIEDHVVRLREVLDREREERNYFQLERDKIQSFREVTDRKHSEVKAELKNLEKAIEDDQAHHLVGIKVMLKYCGCAITNRAEFSFRLCSDKHIF